MKCYWDWWDDIPRYISWDVTGTDGTIYLGAYLELLLEQMGRCDSVHILKCYWHWRDDIPRYISWNVPGTDEMMYLGTYLEMILGMMGWYTMVHILKFWWYTLIHILKCYWDWWDDIPRYISWNVTGTDRMIWQHTYLEMVLKKMEWHP